MNEIDENIAYLIECATGEKWIPESEAKEGEEKAHEQAMQDATEDGMSSNNTSIGCWDGDAAASKVWNGAKARAKAVVKDTGRDLVSMAAGAVVASKIAKSDKSKLQKTRDIAKMMFRRK